MKHSDSKQTFESGAQRDDCMGKGRPSLISPTLLLRLSHHLEEGAKHYGDRNWEKGMPYCRVIDSIYRHLIAFQQREYDEDHLAAIAANVMFLMHYENAFAVSPDREGHDDRPKKKSEEPLTSPTPEGIVERDGSTSSAGVGPLQRCKAGCGGHTTWSDGYCAGCTLDEKNPHYGTR
jgi:hypothetical protein